jgi:vacuolar iron transporter family protein
MSPIILKFQKNEITEHFVYRNFSRSAKGKNIKVLDAISKDELRHYNMFKKISGKDVAPDRLKIFWYSLMGAIFGITFASKLMEKGEVNAQVNYGKAKKLVKNISAIIKDEVKHEEALIAIIEEEKLGYISSMVLGLNDAIVELTGALAGFTFALQDTKVIGLAGFITGIAAALSMAAAEYMARKSDDDGRNPIKAAFYTGVVYILVVLILVAPYFLMKNYYAAFGFTLVGVFLIILVFSFFVSVIRDTNFKNTFWEMTIVCLGVSFIAFLIGIGARKLLNIQI